MPDMEYICKGLGATLHELILAVFVIRPDPGRPTQISWHYGCRAESLI